MITTNRKPIGVIVKIGIIAPPWVPVPPVSYGGTELIVDMLARGLDFAGHEVVLFTTGDSTCPVPMKYLLENSEGMKMGDMLIEIGHSLAAYEQITDVDIIHDHTVIGPLCSTGQTDIPVVTTNHGPFQDNTMGFWKGVSNRDIPIISISNDQASHADDQINISKVIHHGIDSQRIPTGNGGGGYLACLGRMAKDKGIHIAASVARQAGKKLLIAAKMREPLEHEYFETMVKPLLGDGIEYLGELNTKDKFELLADAEGLLNPIQWAEPFGLVMIEALASGTPVIASPIGAAPEIVTNGLTGFLCNDESEMVEAISNLDQIDRAACRWEAENTFSMKRMVQDHIDFYQQVIFDHSKQDELNLTEEVSV